MKRLLFALLLVSNFASAQITLEQDYPNTIYMRQLKLVHFTTNGYKYLLTDATQIVLYNLNHSVFRTIPLPSLPGCTSFRVDWLSDELFNTNPADFEYVLTYSSTITNLRNVSVYDELGNVLLSRDSFELSSHFPLDGERLPEVVHTVAGSKLMLINQFTFKTSVYSLPGMMPCTMCDQGVISGIQPVNGTTDTPQQLPSPYPNPTNSTTTIPYTLPDGVSSGTIVIYDFAGREVKRYAVTSAFTSLMLSGQDLANGTYSYNLESGETILPGRQFVIAK